MHYPDINLGYLCNSLNINLESLHPIIDNSIWIISFSGGGDSVLSLLILIELHKKNPIPRKLTIFYLDHQHQKITDENERQNIFKFYKELLLHIKFLYVEWAIYRKNIIKISHKTKLSFERTASLIRYKILNQLNKTQDGVFITGHNLSDWYETIILRLNRGCSLDKLIPFNIINYENNNLFFRPLALTPREEVRNILKQHNFKYWNDPTNEDEYILRNKIRKQYPILNYEGLKKSAMLFFKSNTQNYKYHQPYIKTIINKREYHLDYKYYLSLTQNEKIEIKIFLCKLLGIPSFSEHLRNQLQQDKSFIFQCYCIEKENWNGILYLTFRKGLKNLLLLQNKSLLEIQNFIKQFDQNIKYTILQGNQIEPNFFIQLQYGKKLIKKIYSENKLSQRQRHNLNIVLHPHNKNEVLFLPLSIYGLKNIKHS